MNAKSTMQAPDTSRTFVEATKLTPVASAEELVRSFEATPQYVPWPKAYGGDMVAQACAAMMRTTDDDRVVHSTHAYFMRPVDMQVPVRYEVEILRDGRGFSTRQVRARQNGKTAFIGIGSFQVPGLGPEYQKTADATLSVTPDSLASAAEVLSDQDSQAADYWAHGRSFDMRHVNGPVYLERRGVSRARADESGHQAVWVKAFDQLPEQATTKATDDLHRIGLAYVCDYTILETLLRVCGLTWSSDGLLTASLDHSMWFHRPGRIDDWVLYTQEAVSVQSHRGLALGHFFARDGKLLATVAQEGLIRQ